MLALVLEILDDWATQQNLTTVQHQCDNILIKMIIYSFITQALWLWFYLFEYILLYDVKISYSTD